MHIWKIHTGDFSYSGQLGFSSRVIRVNILMGWSHRVTQKLGQLLNVNGMSFWKETVLWTLKKTQFLCLCLFFITQTTKYLYSRNLEMFLLFCASTFHVWPSTPTASNADSPLLQLHIHPSPALPPFTSLPPFNLKNLIVFHTDVLYFHVWEHLFVQALLKHQICQHSWNAMLCSLPSIHALLRSARASVLLQKHFQKGNMAFVCVCVCVVSFGHCFEPRGGAESSLCLFFWILENYTHWPAWSPPGGFKICGTGFRPISNQVCSDKMQFVHTDTFPLQHQCVNVVTILSDTAVCYVQPAPANFHQSCFT